MCHFGRVSHYYFVAEESWRRLYKILKRRGPWGFENKGSLCQQHADKFVMIWVIPLLLGKKRTFTHEWVKIFIFTSSIKLNIRSVVKFVNNRVSEKFLWAVLGWGERAENRVNSCILIEIEITFFKVDKVLKFDVEKISNVLWDNREYYGFGDCESLDCLEEKIQMLHQRWRIIL